MWFGGIVIHTAVYIFRKHASINNSSQLSPICPSFIYPLIHPFVLHSFSFYPYLSHLFILSINQPILHSFFPSSSFYSVHSSTNSSFHPLPGLTVHLSINQCFVSFIRPFPYRHFLSTFRKQPILSSFYSYPFYSPIIRISQSITNINIFNYKTI